MLARDRQPELMDDPSLPRDEHRRALAGLARLNQWTGIARVTYRHVRRHAMATQNRPLHVLDVASGSGDIPIWWAQRAKREGLALQLTLTDISQVAIDTQRQLASKAGVDVLHLHQDCLHSALPSGFDLVTCSLFMHHLDEHQAFCLLQSMQAATDGGLLVCDLDRSRFNLALVAMGAHLVTRSKVVHVDAKRSVKAAFTTSEFKSLAERALARPVRIEPAFPCRFIAKFDEATVIEPVPAFA